MTERIEYGRPRRLGRLEDSRIDESSGLAAHMPNARQFWTHNDDRGDNRLFLIDEHGVTVHTYRLTDAEAVDCEDLCTFRWRSQDWLLVGDVGDKDHEREELSIHLLPIPVIQEDDEERNLETEMVIRFCFEDGQWNCESVGVDAAAGVIYLITKEDEDETGLFHIPLVENQTDELLVAQRMSDVEIDKATGMDLSPDGRRMVVIAKDHEFAFEFVRGKDETWPAAIERGWRPIELPSREQGEAICFAHDGRSLVLTSEGEHQPLWMLPAL